MKRTLLSQNFTPLPVLALFVAVMSLSFTHLTTARNTKVEPATVAPAQSSRLERLRPCSNCPGPTLRRIYAPIISLPEASDSEIVLNSRSPEPIEVTPTFYTAQGDPVIGRPVRLQPAEIRFTPVKALIPAEHRGQRHWGGVSLSYTGGILEVWAQLTLLRPGGKGSGDVTFSILDEGGSDVQEAVWWTPERGTATFALGNSSDTAISTTLQFSDGDSEEVYIAPFATKIVHRRAGKGKDVHSSGGVAESVKLHTVGPVGSLKATGLIVSDDGNFTSSVRFYDSQAVRQPHLFATNLRLKGTTPRLVLKNIGDVNLSARPRFLPGSGPSGDAVELATVELRPQEVAEVNLDSLAAESAARPDLASVSVQVANTGPAGSLIGALYSTDSVSGRVYDVPLRDSGRMRNSTGSYPWRVDGDYTTVVTVTNVNGGPSKFIADVRYPGGHYFIPARELAPGETATFDLRKMIEEQQPDNRGETLPGSALGGQFHWSVFGPEGKLIGRSEVVSLSRGVSSSYSCPTCCPDSGPFSVGGPAVTVYVDGFAQTTVNGSVVDCNGVYTQTGGIWMDSWWSNATAIASVSPVYGDKTQVHGLSAGSSSVGGEWYYTQWDSDGMDCYGHSYPADDSVPVNVVNVTDVTANGATKLTAVTGNANIIHFVTPKGAAGNNVTLLATINPDTPENRSKIDWEGATEDPSNPLQATVAKGFAAKNVVKIKVGTTVAKELRVWVVWATILSTDRPIQYTEPVNIVAGQPGATITGGYNFTHTIQPATIITDADRPNFSGANTTPPPGGNHPIFGDPLSGGANRKWDNSRQFRWKRINPFGIPLNLVLQPPGPDNVGYPANDVEGNDDRTTGDETNDPYANGGKLTGTDSPTEGIAHSAGAEGNTYELRIHFREFTRLEIQGTWFRISDYYLWRIHLKFKKVGGKWINDGTDKALDNNGF